MKLIDYDTPSVWVQRKDLALLLKARKSEEVPEEILSKYKSIVEDDVKEPEVYEQFTGKDNIEFINSLDYIIDKRAIEMLNYTGLLQYLYDFMPTFNEAYQKVDKHKADDSEDFIKCYNRLTLMRYKRQEINAAIERKKPKVEIKGKQIGPRKQLIRGLIKNKNQKED